MTVCDGCNVRLPFEHRCHGDGCECEVCTFACEGCGTTMDSFVAEQAGWVETPQDDAGVSVQWCPECCPEAERPDHTQGRCPTCGLGVYLGWKKRCPDPFHGEHPDSREERWRSDLDFTIGQMRGARQVVDSGAEIDRQRLHNLLAAVVPRLEEARDAVAARLREAEAERESSERHFTIALRSAQAAQDAAEARAEAAEQRAADAEEALREIAGRVGQVDCAVLASTDPAADDDLDDPVEGYKFVRGALTGIGSIARAALARLGGESE